jgi:hypothetical protein
MAQSTRKDQRKNIGEDIKTAQFGWPLGMPSNSRLKLGFLNFCIVSDFLSRTAILGETRF